MVGSWNCKARSGVEKYHYTQMQYSVGYNSWATQLRYDKFRKNNDNRLS